MTLTRADTITVRDVVEEVLPAGTRILGGEAALGRRVSWASALRLTTGFSGLEPGSIALLSLETLRLMPARPSAAQAIQALGQVEVAAVLLRGCLESYQVPMTTLMAERAGLALVQLPGGRESAVSAVEAAINAYLARRRGL